MSYFPTDIPFMSDEELIENGIKKSYKKPEVINSKDLVPVVRCKQCGWSMESREVPGMYMCKNDDAVDNYVRPEFACILAERREG